MHSTIDCMGANVSIFKRLGRIGHALNRARIRKTTIQTLDSLPPEIQKDIGWAKSIPGADEIRLPF
ncbi:hypothetical protein C9427_02105 [Mesorhizobium helmanticense]|uniref:DUF1127 domain-containing protein n=1 Tax=Mesorhizobium helmanticense TaxID=1776423 RepID=A0A2T4J2I2_9HYPH|nr:hypothetical protein C9427_02105 [Mesorhizobium helmanticense]